MRLIAIYANRPYPRRSHFWNCGEPQTERIMRAVILGTLALNISLEVIINYMANLK